MPRRCRLGRAVPNECLALLIDSRKRLCAVSPVARCFKSHGHRVLLAEEVRREEHGRAEYGDRQEQRSWLLEHLFPANDSLKDVADACIPR